MRKVRLDHVRGTEFTVITFADWTATSIWDRGNGYVFLDTEGGDEPEYFVVVRSTGSDLQHRSGATGANAETCSYAT